MNNKRILVCLASVGLLVRCVPAMEAVLQPNGNIRFGGCELQPLAFFEGWLGEQPKGSYEIKTPGVVRFHFESHGASAFDAVVSSRQLPDGRVQIDSVYTAKKPVTMEALGSRILLPASVMLGKEWIAGEKRGTFTRPATGGIQVARGTHTFVEFPLPRSGVTVRVATTNGTDYVIQDSRRWADEFSVRFGCLRRRRFAAGETFAFSLILSASEPLTASDQKPFIVRAGADWIPLQYRRDIESGSALDFSRMGFTDGPAGKHGWLRNVGGHFEFENLPGCPQRFYGVNLCGTANYPDHALADILVTRFKRLGYNALRIHHHDAGSVEGSKDGLTLNTNNMDRLDYLLAAAIRGGLYITTDIFVSRSRAIKWRHIGIDQDGTMDIQRFKALCAVYEPAFENWAAYARNFLLHRNPYTGRRYADEPALPLISLVNEGGLFMGWGRGVCDDPRVLASWKSWLAAKRTADPSFAPGVDGDTLPKNFWSHAIDPVLAQWTGELEARMVARMKAVLKGLGCKALLTNDNCGPHYAALQMATVDYDYIDDHFYVDHPSFLEQRWRLPSQCANRNPLLGSRALAPSTQAFTRMMDKPFTITEWNFSGPGRYRGVGGILTGAMAALQDWDGLWRFAYSHTRDGLKDADLRSPGYFDLSSDPLAQASERASLCLFLRGDIAPLMKGVALLVTSESVTAKKTLLGAPSWPDAAWRLRVGSCLSPESAGGLRVIRREDAEGAVVSNTVATLAKQTALRIDRARGAFTIDTPRTCGGFAPEGDIEAGLLKATLGGAAATVWVHALDDEVISRSRRLLLTHLTDVQGEDTKFTDETMTVLLKWGKGPLVKNGTAAVSLQFADTCRRTVYELATSGRRMREIPSEMTEGQLRFTASVSGPDGARILYEIVAAER